jgi:hypothetical protein
MPSAPQLSATLSQAQRWLHTIYTMTLRQQKTFSNIILHCSLTLSITKIQKRVAYWRLIELASLSMSSSDAGYRRGY